MQKPQFSRSEYFYGNIDKLQTFYDESIHHTDMSKVKQIFSDSYYKLVYNLFLRFFIHIFISDQLEDYP